MKKVILIMLMTLAILMFFSFLAFAQDELEETVISGNLRLGYENMKDPDEIEPGEESKYESTFSIDFLELMVKKQVGSFGVYLNERIGDNSKNYLYEGWIYYNIPRHFGTLKAGLVPVPFGIFQNGLYRPKGILYDKNWMWDYDYGVNYEGKYQISDTLGVAAEVAYLNNENSASELEAFTVGEDGPVCLGEHNTFSGRIEAEVGIEGFLLIEAGGSAQMGKLNREGQKDDKIGFAGDLTISPKMITIPVALTGEFVNYSLREDDSGKGNLVMAQADITPVQKLGMLDEATLSLHAGMDMPKEKTIKSKINLIGQLLLVLDKQFRIYTQVFGDIEEDADELSNQGIRVWFMYIF